MSGSNPLELIVNPVLELASNPLGVIENVTGAKKARKKAEAIANEQRQLASDRERQLKEQDQKSVLEREKSRGRLITALSGRASRQSSRGGTILTSPLGEVSNPVEGQRKTILGA